MPKYMILASYTAEGTRGLLKEGGSKRRAVVESLVKGLGGQLEAFYFAFGENDVVAIIDGTDNATAA
ncbi:MAG: GYD domain-containing protein, partial [Dehalococcoidia bacterium]